MISILLACVLCVQSEKELTINERFRVEYVMLDVMAVDRKGNVVTDLTVDDFTVLEDRKKVDVTHFETLDLRMGQPASEEVGLLEVQGPRIKAPQIIVAFDFASLNGAQVTNATHQIGEFLGMLDRSVPVRLCVYDLDSGAVTQGFVSYLQEAIDALERYKRLRQERRTGQVRPWNRSSGSIGGSGLTPGLDDLVGLEKGLERCLTYPSVEGTTACIQATLDDFSKNFEERCFRVIGELESLMYEFQEAEGLKMIFLVSPGFSFGLPITAEDMAQYYLNVATQGAPGHRVVGVGRNRRIKREYQRVVHACIKNRIIFYPIDIFNEDAGSRRMMSASRRIGNPMAVTRFYHAYQKDAVEGLQALADDSGGRFFQVNNLPSHMMDTCDNKTFFYVLGYQSPSGDAGEFRKIKVKCKRRKVKVFHRKGYVGAS